MSGPGIQRLAGVLAAAALAALAACSSAPPKPTPYSNADWGFAATFPGQPTVNETKASATTAHSVLVEANAGDDDFAVTVIDAAGADGLPSEILDRAQQVLAKDHELDVGSNTPVQVGDVTAREVRFDKDGKPVMLSRLLMINGKLYEVYATSAKGVTDPAVKAFMDSFHLVDSPAPAAPAGNAASNATGG